MAAVGITALHDCVLSLFHKLNDIVDQNDDLKKRIVQLETITVQRFSALETSVALLATQPDHHGSSCSSSTSDTPPSTTAPETTSNRVARPEPAGSPEIVRRPLLNPGASESRLQTGPHEFTDDVPSISSADVLDQASQHASSSAAETTESYLRSQDRKMVQKIGALLKTPHKKSHGPSLPGTESAAKRMRVSEPGTGAVVEETGGGLEDSGILSLSGDSSAGGDSNTIMESAALSSVGIEAASDATEFIPAASTSKVASDEVREMSVRRSGRKVIPNSEETDPEESNPLLVIAGGAHCSKVWRTVEAFDPCTRKWSRLPPMITARMSAGMAVLNKHLYVIGGENDAGRKQKVFDSVERYNSATDGWTDDVAPLPFARSGFGTAVLDNFIYVIGGCDGKNVVKTTVRYNSQSNEWISVADMSYKRKRVSALALNGFIYAVGGNSVGLASDSRVTTNDGASELSIGRLSVVERYDPTSNRWINVHRLFNERDDFAGCVFGGSLYVVGGRDNSQKYLSSCERFDPRIGEWMPIGSLLVARSGAGIHAYENNIFLFGGHDDNNALRSVEIYDPRMNAWRHGDDMQIRRYMCGVGIITTAENIS